MRLDIGVGCWELATATPRDNNDFVFQREIANLHDCAIMTVLRRNFATEDRAISNAMQKLVIIYPRRGRHISVAEEWKRGLRGGKFTRAVDVTIVLNCIIWCCCKDYYRSNIEVTQASLILHRQDTWPSVPFKSFQRQ